MFLRLVSLVIKSSEAGRIFGLWEQRGGASLSAGGLEAGHDSWRFFRSSRRGVARQGALGVIAIAGFAGVEPASAGGLAAELYTGGRRSRGKEHSVRLPILRVKKKVTKSEWPHTGWRSCPRPRRQFRVARLLTGAAPFSAIEPGVERGRARFFAASARSCEFAGGQHKPSDEGALHVITD